MTNEIMTRPLLDLSSAEAVRTLKATVAQGLTDPEFALFVQHCKGTGLNPFKKEVWAIKAGGRLQIMTGLNGYLAIANSHAQFDGLECETDNDERPTKAICRVWRKDRKFPATGVALMKEYAKDTPIWRQMPRVMITKVAKSIALREAFIQELGGTYTEEEMPPEYRQQEPKPEPVNITPVEPQVVREPEADNVPQSWDAPHYVYDVSRVNPASIEKAQKLLAANRATSLGGNMWQSPVKIESLAKAFIEER